MSFIRWKILRNTPTAFTIGVFELEAGNSWFVRLEQVRCLFPWLHGVLSDLVEQVT